MKKQLALSLFTIFTSASFAQSGKHVHDEGELMLSQEGHHWQLQFNIPGVNAFGFEHEPENRLHVKKIQNFVDLIKSSKQIVSLNGDCELETVEESLSAKYLKNSKQHDHHNDHKHDHGEHGHDHGEHGHDHDDHKHDHGEHKHAHEGHKHDHDEHKHDHDEHKHGGEESHLSAEFTYFYHCDKLVTQLELNLFNHVSVEKLDVMWITEKTQGASQATANSKVVKL